MSDIILAKMIDGFDGVFFLSTQENGWNVGFHVFLL